MKKPYLDYYAQRNIIPVHQDISNLELHFTRREGLYRSLGIVPGLLAGKAVVELGPGTGDNAVYIAHLRPAEFLLVDGSPASVEEIEAKRASGMLPGNVSVVQSDILEFTRDGHFDLVLCEGVAPGQADPGAFLRHIARLASVGGVVVLTTVSATSTLADVCRRVIKPLMAPKFDGFDDLLAFLADFFKEDLQLLRGMSRKRKDWVLDQILHPWTDELFTIPDAVAAIGETFDLHSSSPRFVTDWRWYKAVTEDDFGFNRVALESYRRSCAGLIDYRCDPATITRCDGDVLEEMCRRAYWRHVDAWHNDDRAAVDSFLGVVDEIADYTDGG